VDLPKHIKDIFPTKYNSGTIVRWVNCDRLILKRASKLVPHIEWPLGRIFRYFLSEKKVEIKIRVFQDNGTSLSENFALSKMVKPVDPLFLMTDTQLFQPFNTIATNKMWQDGEYLFPDPNGDKENKELFKTIGDSIKLKFSIATTETKRLGGDSPLGRIYRQFIGISVLRAGREIKLDDFGFIGELGDPLNRWWKVELSFEPNFDKYFGLDNTKQNVHAFKKIVDKDQLERTEEDVQLEFICKLSEFIENQIKGMKGDIDAIDAGSRGGRGGSGTGNGGANIDGGDGGQDTGPFPSGAVVVPLPDDSPENIEEEKDEVKEDLKR
jgi:hypothetical protein